MPVWRKQLGDPQADPESLLQRSSLAHIMDRLRSNPKVHILHNVDDFLAERNPSKRSKRRWATKWRRLSIRRTSRQYLVSGK